MRFLRIEKMAFPAKVAAFLNPGSKISESNNYFLRFCRLPSECGITDWQFAAPYRADFRLESVPSPLLRPGERHCESENPVGILVTGVRSRVCNERITEWQPGSHLRFWQTLPGGTKNL